MRTIAPILIGLCLLVPRSPAQTPSDFSLPATLNLSSETVDLEQAVPLEGLNEGLNERERPDERETPREFAEFEVLDSLQAAVPLEDYQKAALLDELEQAPVTEAFDEAVVLEELEAGTTWDELMRMPFEAEAIGQFAAAAPSLVRSPHVVVDSTREANPSTREANPSTREANPSAREANQSTREPIPAVALNEQVVEPSSYDESLGEKIRNRDVAKYPDEGTAQDSIGPSDDLDDENAFDRGYFNDIDSKESRRRTALRYLAKLRRPITDIRIASGSEGKETPKNYAQLYGSHEASTWVTASGASIPLPDRYTIGFCHRPLYYEELDLERCGLQHGCLQYEVSGFYFLWNTLVLPYRMATQCPSELVCSRGDCRSCQYYPSEIEPLKCNKRGILAESAAIAGFTFLLL